MPIPDMMSQMRQYAGLGNEEDTETPPVNPEDYLAGVDAETGMPGGDTTNPVALGDNEPMVAYGMGEEPQPVDVASGMRGVSAGTMGSELPEGPETEMGSEGREDLYDLLAQRAKARAARSEYFQKKAREMAGQYF